MAEAERFKSECERLLNSNTKLIEEVNSLKGLASGISESDLSKCIDIIKTHINSIDNFNRAAQMFEYLGSTKSGVSVILFRDINNGNNFSLEFCEGDILSTKKLSSSLSGYQDITQLRHVSRLIDGITSAPLRDALKIRLKKINESSISTWEYIDNSDGQSICYFDCSNNTANCGAMFIYGMDDDGLEPRDFVEGLQFLSKRFSKNMFFGTDRIDGQFHLLLEDVSKMVNLEKTDTVLNVNSGNSIFTFQISL
jgi:hypothetical protein